MVFAPKKSLFLKKAQRRFKLEAILLLQESGHENEKQRTFPAFPVCAQPCRHPVGARIYHVPYRMQEEFFPAGSGANALLKSHFRRLAEAASGMGIKDFNVVK
jgi:hypothetical protein